MQQVGSREGDKMSLCSVYHQFNRGAMVTTSLGVFTAMLVPISVSKFSVTPTTAMATHPHHSKLTLGIDTTTTT